ncbi:uncharacterized protein LAESUDRAFT_772394 [Laetiporus sulphureus 93-53]|uniref:Telomerase reverse transcriptase n=1 Tax=Laetiporus sulphureus 93-53 TaxID=1314785 RepID=A0A165EU91_9APHY|nr:uncharacterized protein LAESUDRAFT_772394 [Laetiporus sulphureus 93-53]KZT07774.1 hypothetical protein LAESUDRAFT_772394 [Laetiporus sulphureus 93-53]
MSEYTSQLRTQASVSGLNASTDTIGNPIIPQGLTQARRHAQHKPRFAEFACSFAEVSRYAILATNAVIPRAFWGSGANRRVVYKRRQCIIDGLRIRLIKYADIQGFIASRRYEKTTLHNVLQVFSVTECDWLAPDSAAAKIQSRVSVTDALKRRELLEEFLFWYYDSFLMPLLKVRVDRNACAWKLVADIFSL